MFSCSRSRCQYALRLLVVFVSFFLVAEIGFGETLKITKVTPEPNYSTKHVNALENTYFSYLSDGAIQHSDMWSKPGSLTWSQPNIIELAINISNSTTFTDRKKIGFHFGSEPTSGVDFPGAINIYEKNSSGAYRSVGEWLYVDTASAVTSNWIWVELANLSESEIRVVVHPRSKVVSLDEVEIDISNSDSDFDVSKNIDTVQLSELHSHSFSKLVNSKRINSEELDSGHISFFYPFDGNTISESSLSHRDAFNFYGDGIVYLGMRLGSDSSRGCVELHLDEKFTVHRVLPVFSVYGEKRHDAVVPYLSCGQQLNYPRELQSDFYLIEIDLASLSDNSETFEIRASNENGAFTEASFVIEVNGKSHVQSDCLVVNPWSYSTELPLWRNREAAYSILRKNLVDVFYVPPAQLPRLRTTDKFDFDDEKRERDFADVLDLYRDAQFIVLFARLDHRLDWGSAQLPISADILRRWISDIQRIVEDLELDPRKILIHPMDEVRDEGWLKLQLISNVIEEYDPKFGLFVNPILSRNRVIEGRIFMDLLNEIAVIQPEKRFYQRYQELFKQKKISNLWFYENPSYPPKEESLIFYGNLAKYAKENSISGVGFWSATASSGISSWSDIDGARPDWSHFYEYGDDIVPSLRWLSFREGLRKTCAGISGEGSI